MMSRELFVEQIKRVLRDQSIDELISLYASPPGRKPKENLVRISKWFNNLGDFDRQMVREVMTDSIENTIFGFFCILDHVRFLDKDASLEIKLFASQDKETTYLNDPEDEPLHDIFNGLASKSPQTTV